MVVTPARSDIGQLSLDLGLLYRPAALRFRDRDHHHACGRYRARRHPDCRISRYCAAAGASDGAYYPGAFSAVLQDSVATVIEDRVNGVDDVLYMSSTSSNDGSYALTVTFAVGTDPGYRRGQRAEPGRHRQFAIARRRDARRRRH